METAVRHSVLPQLFQRVLPSGFKRRGALETQSGSLETGHDVQGSNGERRLCGEQNPGRWHFEFEKHLDYKLNRVSLVESKFWFKLW